MTTATATIERMPLDQSFAIPADPAAVQRAASALRSHGFEVEVVADAASARDLVLSRIPTGSEVHSGASATLAAAGIAEALEQSGDYLPLRPRIIAMDRQTQGDAIRKLGAAPDVFVNSAQAVTEDGSIVFASFGGSQLAPIASGAGKVYLVVGVQKVVPDLATAIQRIETYALPVEDMRIQEMYGIHSQINKILVLRGEFPGRITVVLVEAPIGV
jgi:hypothetical protein